MSLRDRGIKKFHTALMPPELVSMLKKLEKEQDFVSPPVLDEQQMEQFHYTICESMEYTFEVAITYYKNKSYNLVIGLIHYLNVNKMTIKIVDKFGECEEIEISSIIDVQTV